MTKTIAALATALIAIVVGMAIPSVTAASGCPSGWSPYSPEFETDLWYVDYDRNGTVCLTYDGPILRARDDSSNSSTCPEPYFAVTSPHVAAHDDNGNGIVCVAHFVLPPASQNVGNPNGAWINLFLDDTWVK